MSATTAASAQLHWDAAVEAGVMKRFLDREGFGAPRTDPGPVVQAKAHVALLPLLRLGAWLAHDLSPLGEGVFAWNTRQITSTGVRVKGLLPSTWWPTLRFWAFVGIGYAAAYQRNVDRPTPQARVYDFDIRIQGAGGELVQVPFGLGASYKLSPRLALTTELAAIVGFDHRGDLYTGQRIILVNGSPPSGWPSRIPSQGDDRFALAATIGLMIDR